MYIILAKIFTPGTMTSPCSKSLTKTLVLCVSTFYHQSDWSLLTDPIMSGLHAVGLAVHVLIQRLFLINKFVIETYTNLRPTGHLKKAQITGMCSFFAKGRPPTRANRRSTRVICGAPDRTAPVSLGCTKTRKNLPYFSTFRKVE